jgi:hypothetical protein
MIAPLALRELKRHGNITFHQSKGGFLMVAAQAHERLFWFAILLGTSPSKSNAKYVHPGSI